MHHCSFAIAIILILVIRPSLSYWSSTWIIPTSNNAVCLTKYIKFKIQICTFPLRYQIIRRDLRFAWHVTIYERQSSNRLVYICGGSLVSKSFVLTAAHCVAGHSPERIRIELGKSYSSKIIRIIVHPLYFGKASLYGSDIALLELASSLRSNEFVQPMIMENWKLVNYTPTQTMGYVPVKQENGHQIISIPIVGYEKCLAGQRKDFWKFITFTSFCSGWADRARNDVCNGDSGSGLVVYCERTGRWWLKVMVRRIL